MFIPEKNYRPGTETAYTDCLETNTFGLSVKNDFPGLETQRE
jgi:hypothetical protein